MTRPATEPATRARDAPSHAAAWREAVLELRYAERRRVFPTALHLGVPGGARVTHVHPSPPGPRGSAAWDHALRADVVGALLDRWAGPTAGSADGSADGPRDGPLCWVTRGGPLDRHDDDLAWLAASRVAYAEAGLDLALVVVTHVGWYDPATGEGRTWKRLRRAPSGTGRAAQSQAWTGSLECIRSR